MREIYNPIETPKTTFIKDFQIANAFGKVAVKDTFKRASKEWKNDILYLTELTFVTNMFAWFFYERMHDDEMSKLYCDLYRKSRNIVYRKNSPFTEEDLEWFFQMTD